MKPKFDGFSGSFSFHVEESKQIDLEEITTVSAESHDGTIRVYASMVHDRVYIVRTGPTEGSSVEIRAHAHSLAELVSEIEKAVAV